MEEIYLNCQPAKPVHGEPATTRRAPQTSDRRLHGAVVVCLGLLSVSLLVGLIGLGVHYRDSVRGLREERDRLNGSLVQKAEELELLRRRSKQKLTCPAGWRMFGCSCYLLSNVTASWDKARQHCRGSDADLAVIDSREEQLFLVGLIREDSWIGLSDRDAEGSWRWTDGTPLNEMYWCWGQPDNGKGDPQWGEEDCANIKLTCVETEANWNDLRCDALLRWICEKPPSPIEDFL